MSQKDAYILKAISDITDVLSNLKNTNVDLSQIEQVRGKQGERGEKGEKGEPFIFEDFTQEQLAQLAELASKHVEKGYTPVKGQDYFTDQEIQQIIKVIEAGIEVPAPTVVKETVEVTKDITERKKELIINTVLKQLEAKLEDFNTIARGLESLPEKDKLDPENALKDFRRAVQRVQILAGGGSNIKTLAALQDVNLTGLADKNSIVWDAATNKWIPAAIDASVTLQDAYDNSSDIKTIKLTSTGDFRITDSSDSPIFYIDESTKQLLFGNVLTANERLNVEGNIDFDIESTPSPASTAALNATAGNLTGAYRYVVTFVTSEGETDASASSNQISATNQQIDVSNIPTGSANVTSRKLYRDLNGSGVFYFVDTIPDNTTTTYTDNIDNATVLANPAAPGFNSTAGIYKLGGTDFIKGSSTSTAVGLNAFGSAGGARSSAFGAGAGFGSSQGDNTFLGYFANYGGASSYSSTVIGASTALNKTLQQTTIIGTQATITGTSIFQGLLIGYNAQSSASAYAGAIGANSLVSANNTLSIGQASGASYLNVVIGDTAPAGGARFSVVGTNDQVQAIFKANSTQNFNIFEVQNSSGINYAWFDGEGKFQADLGTGLQGYFMLAGAGNSTATGFRNLGIGRGSMTLLTTGAYNVSYGQNALNQLTVGNNNVGIGYDALFSTSTGQRNFGLGFQAGRSATNASDMIAIGYQAANAHTGTGQLVAVGFQALGGTTDATRSVGIGYQAGYQNAGSYSVYIGAEAGEGNIDTSNCVFIGAQAGNGETNDYRLHIATRFTSASPLIYGEFDNKLLRTNGRLEVIGANDTVQFITKANSTQNSDIVQVQDSSGNADVFVIDANERVGIGLTSPGTYKMQVYLNTTDTSLSTFQGRGRYTPTSVVGNVFPTAHSNLAQWNTDQTAGGSSFLTSFRSRTQIQSSGSIPVRNLDIFTENTSTAVVTDVKDIIVRSAINSGGGSITSYTALYIDSQTVAGTNYSIRTFDGYDQLYGGQIRSVTTVNSATYTVGVNDYILHVTRTSTGTCTITVPTAQIAINGRVLVIKDAGGNASVNNITIETEGSETIDGASNLIINGDYTAITLYSDGSNLFIGD